ncbi:glycosyltransferase family 2 protein [Formosa sp. 3Alg 14/1]|uniref:glycosyltransferase family 2 protein n=1 Tax=Formosa sp. 3Alg 14/1 TaxID=3382190 RepID=UPI0039BE1B5A
MKNMLAIVIPFYKAIFFRETLNSLVSQTNKKFKVYIGNDASPDSIDELVKEYSDYLELSYTCYENNLGHKSLVSHWKRCLALIKQEAWFMILCDDDILSPNYVESFYNNINKIEQSNSKVIRYSSILISDTGEEISEPYKHPVIENSIDSYVRKAKGFTRSSLSEYVFKNDIDDVNKVFIDFPNAYYSDDLSILLASNFGDIYSINEAFFYFRRGNYNLSGVNSDVVKGKKAEFLFYKYLFKNYSNLISPKQKQIFLFRLNRQVVFNKSFEVYRFALKEQFKIFDIKGILYLPLLILKKGLWRKQ